MDVRTRDYPSCSVQDLKAGLSHQFSVPSNSYFLKHPFLLRLNSSILKDFAVTVPFQRFTLNAQALSLSLPPQAWTFPAECFVIPPLLHICPYICEAFLAELGGCIGYILL